MNWRGGCIAREGAHATTCCSMLALEHVRSAGCPARESVAACRGRSCRCETAADSTPGLQLGQSSLHLASESGHPAVVQMLLEHDADVEARVRSYIPSRSPLSGYTDQEGMSSLHIASENGHLAVVQTLLGYGADVAATNKVGARLCGCAEATACGEVELVLLVLPLAELRAYMTFTCIHALATHPLTPLPASAW